MDSQRYDADLIKHLTGGVSFYNLTPIPDLRSFRSIDSWIEASKEVVQFLKGGFCIMIKSGRLSKTLSDVIYVAESLEVFNKHGVISISRA